MNYRRLTSICVLFLALVLISWSALAQSATAAVPPLHAETGLPPYTLELVDQIGGQTNLVVLRPPYAYVAAGPRILVLDVSDPANVAQVGRSDMLPNNLHNMVLAGDRLVGEIYDGELLSIDISQPLTPTLTTHAQIYNRAPPNAKEQTTAIAASGDRVYLLSFAQDQLGTFRYDYLRTVDAVTLSPFIIHTLNAPYSDLAVAGTTLFGVRTNGGLTSFDVANPALPQERQTIAFNGTGGQVATLGSQVMVAQRMDDSYVLRVLDSDDPGNMVQTGLYTQTTERGIVGLQAHPGVAYVRLSGFTPDVPSTEVDLIDLSAPTPQRLGVYTDSVQTADMAVNGGRLYLAHADTGLQIVDALAPSGKQILGTFAHHPFNQTLAVNEPPLLVTGGGWIGAFSLQDPFHPSLSHAIDLGEPTITDLVITSGRAYVSGAQVTALDLSNSPQLAILSQGGQTDLSGLATANGLLYGVRDGPTGGVFVMNPAAEPALSVVGSEISFPGQDIAVTGNYAVIPNSSYGAHLYDLSDPSAPQVLSTLAVPLRGSQTPRQPNPNWTEFTTAGVWNNLAFVGGKNISCCLVYAEVGALWVIDIANPARPALLSSFSPGSLIQAMDIGQRSVMQRYGFLATSTGPMVIDTANPAKIDLVASASTRNLVGIAANGNFIYTTDSEWGLVTWFFPGRTRSQISPSGGELHAEAGRTSYFFESGVFTESVTVEHIPLLPEQVPPATDQLWANHAFRIATAGKDWWWEPEILAPFTVTVGISAADRTGILSGTLALYRWDAGAWHRLAASQVMAAGEEVTAALTEWGIYAVLGDTRRTYLPFVARR